MARNKKGFLCHSRVGGIQLIGVFFTVWILAYAGMT